MKNNSTANLGFEAGFDSVHLHSASIVLANGPAAAGSSNQSAEGHIRRALIGAEFVAKCGDSQ